MLSDAEETVGARFFMAPEQEQGRTTEVTFAADVYGLGKLLHYMITSRHLYRERLSEAFMGEELEGDPRLSLVHEELLARTIVEDPAERIQSAQELFTSASELLDLFRTPLTRLIRILRWRPGWLKRAH